MLTNLQYKLLMYPSVKKHASEILNIPHEVFGNKWRLNRNAAIAGDNRIDQFVKSVDNHAALDPKPQLAASNHFILCSKIR